MVLYLEFTYGYQFSEETNGSEIHFLIPEILNKYKRSIFVAYQEVPYEGSYVTGLKQSSRSV